MSAPRTPGWLSRVLPTRAGLPGSAAERRVPLQARPTPLTRDRVVASLSSRGYHHRVDEDGDLTGVWNESRFWFLLLGEQEEILQVRGRWHRQLPVDSRRAVALALNDWNRERIWPKLYLREEEGELAVYSEVSTDLEHGVTAEQLEQLISCGLGTGVQSFASFDALLPPQL